MSSSYLQPITLKNGLVNIKNRVALAPLTNGQSHEDGTLGEDELHWLKMRAEGGFGTIISCASHVSKTGQGWPGQLGIFSDVHIDGLKTLARNIHEHNAILIMQLYHGGARSPEYLTGQSPWSASKHLYKAGDKSIAVKEGSEYDIDQVIDDFVNAAQRAIKAGCDGIELHAAHGYLLHQFLSTETNQRQDGWGGSLKNRAKILTTIINKIQAISQENFVIGVRISPEDKYTFKGIDFDDSLVLAELLEEQSIDYLHISTWDAKKTPEKYPLSNKTVIQFFREKCKIPIMVAGEIWTIEDAENALYEGADMVALGKAGIGIPNWPKLAENEHFQPNKPPYTESHLQNAGLSHKFIDYMKKWAGFVVN
ncbi:MAG: NADH:flavin oxidoreductase [Lewinellaceae bacterium]|nr:NADH:flavin oxidoreductase [Lewinellaceae bacterium]